MPMQGAPPLTLVELFGAPGAGKTTVAAAAISRLPATTRHQLAANWRRQPLARRIGYVVRGFSHAGRLSGAARLAFGCGLRNPRSLARLARVIAKAEWLRTRNGTILLDQGILQDIWSILFLSGCSEPNPSLLSPLIRSIYDGLETRIVFIDVGAQTAASRVGARKNGHSPLDGLPEGEVQNSLVRAAGLPPRIIDAAKAAGLRILALDGSEPVEALVEKLLSAVPGGRPSG
jgi:thymidylate kinase